MLQAETFAVSGTKIRTEDRSKGRGILEDRLESVRGLHKTIDLLFRAFCARRLSSDWQREVERMRPWLRSPSPQGRGET